MSEVFGVWEHPPNADLPAHAALCLLDRGDAVRLYLRMTIQGQQLVSDTVLPLDGSRVGMGDSTVVARREHGALVLEREGGGTPAGRTRYERVEEGLLERHEGGTEHLYLPSSTKQVLVYRRELQMRKGKIAAQCAHGSMAVFFRRDPVRAGRLDIPLDGPMEHWSRGSFAKVVLSVETEDELLTIHREAQASGLPTAIITDAGRTEFKGVPTRTVVAVGPAVLGEIDRITGKDGLVACKLA